MTVVTEQLIPDNVLRTLRYLQTVNDGGALVAWSDLDAWAHLPPPSSRLSGGHGYGLFYSLDQVAYSEYLLGVGWAKGNPLRITAVGRAILKAHDETHAGVVDNEQALVVLSPSDPLNLVALTSAVAAAKAGMLVDPYFSDDKRATLRLAAGAADRAGRSLEIRCPVGTRTTGS